MNLTSVVTQATCTLNGQIVSCEQLTNSVKHVLGWGLGGFLVILILVILATIFWLAMLIHAIRHPIEHKPIWILIMIIAGIVGAVIYYFAVKKQIGASPGTPLTGQEQM